VSSTLVIVPTHQEADNVAEVLTRIRAASDADILVIDDGSDDGTAEIAEHLDEQLGNITVLRRVGKTGLGDAYRAGLAWGLEHDYEVLVQIDADLSHDPAVLPELISAAALGADLAIGSRYVPGGAIVGWPGRRLFLSRWGNRYVAILLGLAINDATAGYRAFRADVVRRCDLVNTTSSGYAFQIETTYRLVRAGARIVEIPIIFRERASGSSKMNSSIVREGWWVVTKWGVRDILGRRRRSVTAISDHD
jgi:dolichol-phosphate mannosyltransferase